MINYFEKIEHKINDHQRAVFWSVLIAAFILILTRKPDIVRDSQFWAEDGHFWYADAYNQGLKSLFNIYDGYWVFLYHAVALVSIILPLKYAPLFFSIVAVLFQLIPLALINSSRLKSVIPYKSLGILISFIYIAVPNSNEVFGNLTNVQWHLGVASLLVLLAATPKSKWWIAFDISILLATGLSGPLVIMLLPIAAILWWQKRDSQRMCNMLIVLALAMVQFICIFFLSSFHRVGSQPGAGIKYLAEMGVGQIFTGGVLGQSHVKLLYPHVALLIIALFVALMLSLYTFIKGPISLKIIIGFGFLVFVSMIVSLKPLPGNNLWMSLTNPADGQRYWYIPILCWLSVLLWILFAARPKLLKIISGALLLLLIFVGIPGNWSIPSLPNMHFGSYAKRFQSLPAKTVYSIPTNPSGWNVTLIKR